jgi:RNA recognition motif-containing protein
MIYASNILLSQGNQADTEQANHLFQIREGLIKMSKKLYIGNLSYKVTEEDLKKKFGEIGEC